MPDATKYTNKLHGARVLVIGGSSGTLTPSKNPQPHKNRRVTNHKNKGIGFGVAEALLEHGSHVFISSSNPDRVTSTIEKLLKDYPSAKERVQGFPCQLGEQASLDGNVKKLFENVTKEGKLDHVVFTAGDSLAMMNVADAEMEKILQAGMVRFFAPLMVAKHAPAYMNPGPKSSLVLTTGSVSERPRPDWTIVNSFATGLQGMTRGLALDLKPLRVNLISPGVVDTELWGGMSEEQKKKLFEESAAKLPTGRVPSPSDVAEVYLACLKDQNMTGSMISTNGGALLV
ncbi:hypothetical protein LTR62_008275 [Meristemomyces frigidus]|uniref:Uncharacterized protein n=1 Tax=Meristemomyces frigidus TaxID=1508187 RepID=A0AAN7TA34_9PEZI|nr:hypothetical protein LTR62_008275 [Meristemomyces frigidus]